MLFRTPGEEYLPRRMLAIGHFQLKTWRMVTPSVLMFSRISSGQLLIRRKAAFGLTDSVSANQANPTGHGRSKQMYNIYAGSTSIIIPEGLGFRLVIIDEKTSWMDRAWTMQEALEPPSQDGAVFLFSSDHVSAK